MGVTGPPIRYLALGDSYTIGESVPGDEAWPNRLADRLGVEPTIVATTAWTSGELLDAIDRDPPVGRFGLVSLQIGVNDQYRDLPLDEFVNNAAILLDRAMQLCDGAADGVFAVSIPDWGVTPFAGGRDRERVAVDIDRFNEALAELTTRVSVPLVDVTAISRAEPGLVAPDGLHPSGEQYRRWVEVIAPVAEAVLGRRAG